MIGLVASWWPVLLVVVLQGGLLLWGSVAPARVLLGVAVLSLCLGFLDLQSVSSVSSVSIMAAAYAVGVYGSGLSQRIGVIGAAVAVFMTVVVGSWPAHPLSIAVSGLAMVAVVLGPPFGVALVVVARRRMLLALRAEKDALERMQAARVEAAIAQEHESIARELHDIAAHHLSGIVLLSAAVERQVDSDREAAKVNLAQIRTQSRLVLADLRTAVGMLRGGEPRAAEAHRVESIAGLVAARQGAGVDIHVRVDRGDRAAVGEGLGPLAHLAGYRMVQEALTNAARHAPGAWQDVHIDDTDAGAVVISVSNGLAIERSASSGEAGSGLQGMRERAKLVGGSVEYGGTDDGGWRVTLRLPREAATEMAE